MLLADDSKMQANTQTTQPVCKRQRTADEVLASARAAAAKKDAGKATVAEPAARARPAIGRALVEQRDAGPLGHDRADANVANAKGSARQGSETQG